MTLRFGRMLCLRSCTSHRRYAHNTVRKMMAAFRITSCPFCGPLGGSSTVLNEACEILRDEDVSSATNFGSFPRSKLTKWRLRKTWKPASTLPPRDSSRAPNRRRDGCVSRVVDAGDCRTFSTLPQLQKLRPGICVDSLFPHRRSCRPARGENNIGAMGR